MRSLALRCQGLASGQAEPAIEAVALARWCCASLTMSMAASLGVSMCSQ